MIHTAGVCTCLTVTVITSLSAAFLHSHACNVRTQFHRDTNVLCAPQKADTKYSFDKLRQEALLTFNQAWSRPGGRPCEGALAAALISDLVGSKEAEQPSEFNGLLGVIWDWTKHCWGSGAAPSAGQHTSCHCGLSIWRQVLCPERSRDNAEQILPCVCLCCCQPSWDA